MTSEPPFSGDFVKQATEAVGSFIRWIAKLIVEENWFTLTVLLAVAGLFLFNPGSGIAFKAMGIDPLPDWYTGAFWMAELALLATALGIAVRTTKPYAAAIPEDKAERAAIKGLRPFELKDAEVYARLQRHQELRDCAAALCNDGFRFGILMGESGCGKTSFLQAGVCPRLAQEDDCISVYVRFSAQPPTRTVAKAIAEALEIPVEQLLPKGQPEPLVTVLERAVSYQDKQLILLFDQFEQFFVHQKRDVDQRPFITALTSWYQAAEPLPVKILVSIRSDLAYQLNALHQTLGYSLGPQDVVQLKKFSPMQAARVLEVIAQTEELEFNRRFLVDLAEEELANREDGLISPVDLQILSWMIERQTTEELRAFNQNAFQKFGGVEGLLTRFLDRTLEARVLPNQRQSAVKVLLALTDLDRQVRAGVLTLQMLKDKLRGTATADEVAEAVNWLSRGDVRLVTPQQLEGETGYELAHERLIPALMRLAGKELSEADRANRMLDRRVNEWLGNSCSPRYLFGLLELWQLRKQRPYLIWGVKRQQKQRLINLSQRRIYGAGLAVALSALLLAAGSAWMYLTPQGQIWNANRQLMGLLREGVTLARATEASVAVAKNGWWRQAEGIINAHLQTSDGGNKARDARVAEAVVSTANFLPRSAAEQPMQILDRLQKLAAGVEDDGSKSSALREIARASVELGDETASLGLLEASLSAAQEIEDDGPKSSALREIARAYLELGDETASLGLLEASLSAAQEIEADGPKSSALSAITDAIVALPESFSPSFLFDDVLNVARADSVARPMVNMASHYAKQEDWGKALDALKTCGRTDKAIGLTNMLTALAEHNNPRLIEGAIVLDVEPVSSPSDYTLTVTLQSMDEDCDRRADWWEIVSLDGELKPGRRKLLEGFHRGPETFQDSLEHVNLQPDEEVLIRAHFQGNYLSKRDPFSTDNHFFSRSGYTDQALKGSIETGFHSVRISENFAKSLEQQEPLPDKDACSRT